MTIYNVYRLKREANEMAREFRRQGHRVRVRKVTKQWAPGAKQGWWAIVENPAGATMKRKTKKKKNAAGFRSRHVSGNSTTVRDYKSVTVTKDRNGVVHILARR